LYKTDGLDFEMNQPDFAVLLISNRPDELDALGEALKKQRSAQLSLAKDAQEALALAGETGFKLAVIGRELDGPAMELATELTKVNAFINTAIVSDMEHDEFHDHYEGLGVLAQLPPSPGAEHAAQLIELLKGLMAIA
jgi:DNA-binding response OmpR family regulator